MNSSSAVRFVVESVFEITGRGRFVSGSIALGKISMGMRLKPDGNPTAEGWLVRGIEYLDSPSTGEWSIGLLLEHAPPVEALRLLLPPGSALVADEQASPSP